MIAIVGSNGLIGGYLKEVIEYTHEFNSNNIEDIKNHSYNIVYLAAPSGNRLIANADAHKDYQNVNWLYTNLSRTKIDRLVIIGTVDSVLRPHLPYGSNRFWLEENLSRLYNTNILRLSSLIHPRISKNILYDLKHHQYLESINLNSCIQWYDLDNLARDIHYSIMADLPVRNLVSEPIYNREIVEQFFPDLKLSAKETINYSIEPWCYSKEEIFHSMEKYLDA